MLALTRKEQERVVIAEGNLKIVVTVIRASGGVARLGFEAPPNVRIDREEVYRIRQGSQQEAGAEQEK